ncbi:MAG: DUF1080 domain-containing protein [Planctomycetota bacterium]|nr:DUF1080 domain-containing protein [Planctomycetota bacterium]
MKRILPLVLTITLLPLVLLFCTAVYVGQNFAATRPGDSLQAEQPSGWIRLFDGKTLEGWEGNEEFFRVQDEAIVAGNLEKKIPHNEFLCTEKVYKDFELRLEAKLIGEGKNAGIQFRSQRIPNHHEVKGYQCDMGQMKGHSIWGYLYDESRRRKFLVEADARLTDKNTREGEWNEFVLRCEGKRIQIWLNGFRTVNYVETGENIDQQGIIGLQIHGGPPAEAWYRNIRIKKL